MTLNGHDIGIGALLGRMDQTMQHQTVMMHRYFDQQAAVLKALERLNATPPSSPPPEPAKRGSVDTMIAVAKVLAPLILVIGIVAGKISHSDAGPLLRALLGIG